MSDANHGHPSESNSFRLPPVATTPAAAIFIVALLGGLGAAGAVYGLSDLLGLGVAVVIAAAGAAVAAFAAGKPTTSSPDTKAAALLEAVTAEGAPSEPPSRFRSEPWGSLYRRAAGYEEAQRSATLAVQEVERLRLELEKKPGVAAPFEPPPAHAEQDLVGAGSNAGEVSDSVETVDVQAKAREAVAEAVAPVAKELHAIEFELDPLLRSLRSGEKATGTRRNGHPAQMVDALVRTAADGIEDLAAGLMRANELAGVAERVTNRATLLALNAALEATRSGSEAFASIAEETRRLAEYAREATDAISRLSNEIEVKVGEAIGAIQTTSEDAKAAVESMAAGTDSPAPAVAPETLAALEMLLGRVRSLRERAEAVAVAPVRANTESPGFLSTAPAPAYVSLGAVEGGESDEGGGAVSEAPGTYSSSYEGPPAREGGNVFDRTTPVTDPPSDAHGSFGSLTFEGSDPPPAETTVAESAAPEVDPTEAPAPDEATDAPNDAVPPGGTVPGVNVVTKIPDWLEGLEPRDRR